MKHNYLPGPCLCYLCTEHSRVPTAVRFMSMQTAISLNEILRKTRVPIGFNSIFSYSPDRWLTHDCAESFGYSCSLNIFNPLEGDYEF